MEGVWGSDHEQQPLVKYFTRALEVTMDRSVWDAQSEIDDYRLQNKIPNCSHTRFRVRLLQETIALML